MSLLEFQRALSDLVMSPERSAAVGTNQDDPLAAYDLTPIEHERLVALAGQPGIKVGTMIHRSFRLSMLANMLPKTCTVLGSQGLKEIVHAYWQAQPPRSYYYQQEALRFGDFALALLETGDLQHAYLEEILRLELAMIALSSASPEDLPAPSTHDAISHPEGCFPALYPLCRLVFFAHDPERLLPAIAQKQLPDHLPEGAYYLLLDRTSSERVQVKQLNPWLGALLAACDGRQSVAHLCTQFSLTVQDFEALLAPGNLLVLRRAPSPVPGDSKDANELTNARALNQSPG